jgi:hypothetical protein
MKASGDGLHSLAWLAGTAIGYMAMVVPGIVVHVICIYNAYSGEVD